MKRTRAVRRLHLPKLRARESSRLAMAGIMERAEGPILSVDREYRYTSFNQAHRAFMKALYGTDITLGLSLLDCVTDGEDRRITRECLDRALGGERFSMDYDFGPTVGAQSYHQIDYKPIRTPQGDIVGVDLICQDVTERKRAETALEEERARYEDLVKTLPAGIYRLRVHPIPSVTAEEWEDIHLSHYQVEFVSDRFCEISGLDRVAFQSAPGTFLDRLHPEDRKDFSERNAEALTRMTPFFWEGRLLHDGRPRWIRFESSPRRLPDGGSLWTGVLTDITDRRKTSSDYRRVYGLLRQAEAIAKIGGWEIDLETNTLFWSEEVYRIHELDSKSYTPTVESSIQFYAPEWRPVISQAVQGAIATGENFDLNLELLTANGRRLWVHATSQVILREGRVIKVQGAFRDISAERMAANKLAQSHAVLAGVLESAEGPIFSVDRAYRYTSFNQAHAAVMKALYGRDIAEGSRILDDQTVPADRDLTKVHLDRALAGEAFTAQAFSGEEGLSRLFFEVAHTPIRNAVGDITGVAVFARDITMRRHSEEALRRIIDLARQAETIAGVGGWELDFEAKSLFWTEETYRIHDLEPGAYTPTLETALAFYAPEWRPVITSAVQKASETGGTFDLELELITAKGRRIWVHVISHTLSRDGRVVKVLGAFQDISRQKQAELILKEALSQNQALLEAIPDLVFTNRRDGEYLTVHTSDPGQLLVPPEVFLHRKVDEILPGPLAAQFRDAFGKALDARKIQELHYTLPIDGEERHFEARVVRFTEDTVVTLIRDITERKQAEEALGESEHRYRMVFEASVNGLVILERETLAFLDANPAFCGMYGYSLNELKTMKAPEVSTDPEATQRSIEAGTNEVGRRWHRRKDGSVFPVDIRTKAFEDGGRRVSVSSLRDITERVKQEDELRTRMDQLQIMLELASLPDRYAGKELLREGLERIVHVSGSRVGFLHLLLEDQETLELTAWTAETMKHCTANFDTHYPVAMAGIWADAVRLRRPVIHNDYPERVDRKGMPEGHFPLTREIVVPVVESGKVRMIVGVGNKPEVYDKVDAGQLEVMAGDLWKGYARQRAEVEILGMNRDLERRVEQRTHQWEMANQELEAFAYSVSHDLRAPIRAISGFSEALVRDGDSILSPAGIGHLQRIQGGAARMAQLIEDLLQLSRIGRDDFMAIPVDLAGLAEQVLAGLQAADPGRRVTYQVQHPLRIMGDPRLLRILLENLLGNAWKFSSITPDALITVVSRPLAPGVAEISIRDNGAGFPSSQAGKLFTPFYRLHKAEEFPGTGIGLAIAKRVVSRHGGGDPRGR